MKMKRVKKDNDVLEHKRILRSLIFQKKEKFKQILYLKEQYLELDEQIITKSRIVRDLENG